MPFARASELDRLLECAGSARGVLPRAEDDPGYVVPENTARGRTWGTVCHEWSETGIIPANEAYAKTLVRKIRESKMDRLRQWPAEGEHEVALAYNVVTGRAVRCRPPTGSGREYRENWKAGFDLEWVTGTLDYVWELIGTPWVDDLKTGRFLSSTEHEAQQSFYALAWGLVKYGEIVETRSTLTHWPKYPLQAGPRRYGSVFTVEHLTRFARKLAALRERVLDYQRRRTHKNLRLVVGEWCRFCPSKSACPKHAAEGPEESNNDAIQEV